VDEALAVVDFTSGGAIGAALSGSIPPTLGGVQARRRLAGVLEVGETRRRVLDDQRRRGGDRNDIGYIWAGNCCFSGELMTRNYHI
jgi:hypothetical protein